MSALAFLAIAVVISVVGGVILWVFNRNPTRWDSGIHDFTREMQALSPEQRARDGRGSPERRERREEVPPRSEQYGTEEEIGE